MLGCGNSSMYIVLTKALSKDMLDDGYTHILSAYKRKTCMLTGRS